MQLIRKIRFSMGTIMMFVLMVASAMALFVKIQEYTDSAALPGLKTDVPSLLILAIVLTAVALGSWKEHTVVQIMLQVTLACFIMLTLIWIGEAQYETRGSLLVPDDVRRDGHSPHDRPEVRQDRDGPRSAPGLVEEVVRIRLLLILDHDARGRRRRVPARCLRGDSLPSDRQEGSDPADTRFPQPRLDGPAAAGPSNRCSRYPR